MKEKRKQVGRSDFGNSSSNFNNDERDSSDERCNTDDDESNELRRQSTLACDMGRIEISLGRALDMLVRMTRRQA